MGEVVPLFSDETRAAVLGEAFVILNRLTTAELLLVVSDLRRGRRPRPGF